MKPLFICGCPRTGTTILQEVLDFHPRISMTYEQGFVRLWEGLLNTIEPRETQTAYNPASIEVSSVGDVRAMLDYGFLKAFKRFHRRRKPFCKYYGDKMPSYLLIINFIRYHFKGSKFLICERNRKDTLHSMKLTNPLIPDKDNETTYQKFAMLTEQNRNSPDCLVVNLDKMKANKYLAFEEIEKFLGMKTDSFNLSLIHEK